MTAFLAFFVATDYPEGIASIEKRGEVILHCSQFISWMQKNVKEV